MITTSTLDNFWREYAPHSVGLDEVFHRLDALSGNALNYPPYNLIKHDSSNFTIEIALAGFKKDEIEVCTEQNILRVTSKVSKEEIEKKYLHQGLSKRNFSRSWQLSDDVRVHNVTFEDGLLTISLERIIPDHQKKTVYDFSKTKPNHFLSEDC